MRKFSALLPIAPLLAIIAWVGYSFWQAYQPQAQTLQGQIEAQQYNISSKVAGRIDQVLVKKGEQVEPGQLIFSITSPELEAKLEQAKAGQQAASAIAEQAENGARSQEISAAKDQWQKAQAATQLSEKTYQRVNNLFKDGVVSEQKRDEAYTQWQAARYTENSASEMYQMAKAGARDETKKAAVEQLRAAAGKVAEVQAYASDTLVKSWHAGEVSQILLQQGELAPTGFPVVSIIDMQDAWLILHVREDQLSRFQKDQQFSAMLPALNNQQVDFKVSHVAVMGDFATWRATDSRTGFDLRTFEIEARPTQAVPQLRVGMSAIITLEH
ncbi:HlyD family secretion protein [Agarivorans sp. Z349TD_8]|uniref:HlyD family secretion protein n=1 Tax=Agarivorans sp. Z349TD_8 TaxID=3421434 RepID=UPI003D7EDF30